MEIEKLFGGIYKNKVCLVTGHTGFKGSWLSYWLTKMGAKVIGYSLHPSTKPNHYELLKKVGTSVIGDIRDISSLKEVFNQYNPEIIFHLAAQAIVRYSYENPIETYSTNVLGIMNVFEAARHCNSVKAIVNVTSDKCYENKEWIWGYRENDPMGGHDPYSSSKGCSELLTTSYQKSFFNNGKVLLASARAGNVIGGGDWASDRLIPDIVRAVKKNEAVVIRNPYATRPWQHVLEPLSGYLTLGWRLLESKKEFAEGWNFGPRMESNLTVENVVKEAKKYWAKINYSVNTNESNLHEANLLMLDCSKANKLLKWKPVWGVHETFEKTISWYKSYYENKGINTEPDLIDFIKSAKNKNLLWTK
ncbi:MAG: CDP-glucose 4,6-dehydratase [Melioribacteraceae bacterium]|nr:CDP-glucose 4,6-dehydratase [Melioribacteraceae bacterium]